MSDITQILLYALVFIVAFLYASIGHGGASGYLALMALFGVAPESMKSSALILNIMVSGIAFIQYFRMGHFKWKLFWPFAVASIPFAFLGSLIPLEADVYRKILGFLLLFVTVRLLVTFDDSKAGTKSIQLFPAILIGALAGLLAGMTGIGGGVLLSPVMLLMHLATIKQTAAVSSLFIFVNSIAGFAGIGSGITDITPEIITWAAIAIAGGLAGSWFGSNKMEFPLMKKILGLVLLIAGIKLIIT